MSVLGVTIATSRHTVMADPGFSAAVTFLITYGYYKTFVVMIGSKRYEDKQFVDHYFEHLRITSNKMQLYVSGLCFVRVS